jgi:DNA ligase (NAD+)
LQTPIEYIKNCPECGTELVKIEDQAIHFCPNELHCPPQVVGRMIHYVSRKALNIENLGRETIEQLYREKLIENPADFIL